MSRRYKTLAERDSRHTDKSDPDEMMVCAVSESVSYATPAACNMRRDV